MVLCLVGEVAVNMQHILYLNYICKGLFTILVYGVNLPEKNALVIIF